MTTIHVHSPRPLLTAGEAAKVLRLSKRSIYRRVASGEIEAVRLGGAPNSPLRLRPEHLASFIETRTTRLEK
jgi:excisionase family DNA binding protein